MRSLKIIGVVLMVLIGLPLLISLFLPAKVTVKRIKIIKATPSQLFTQVNKLKNWEKWSPWHSIDPNIKLKYNDISEGEGASYSWSSAHENVGNGKVTITESSPYDSIKIDMDFIENGKASGRYYFEKQKDSVKVTWMMDSDLPNPLMKWFGLFMDSFVGPDFEKGLDNLERLASNENRSSSLSAISLESSTIDEVNALTITKTCDPSEISTVLGRTYIDILQFIAQNKLKQSGHPFAIYHSHTRDKIVVEPGIPVESLPHEVIGDIKVTTIKPTAVVIANYYGNPEKSAVAHKRIDKWVEDNNKKVNGSPWEVYVRSIEQESDTSKWLTKIYYPIE
jgi:effector-binding domain-containing protein